MKEPHELFVQVRPCRALVGRCIEQCAVAEAHFYGVYMGTPGDLTWCADFLSYTDALNWAREIAENNECTIFDYVQYEREECNVAKN